MKNSKKLFLIILSVLIVAFVSCKSNENPESSSSTFKVSDIAGTWSGDGITVTIDNDRNVTADYGENKGLTITTISEEDWNSEKTEYTINTNIGISITFKSANNGTLTSSSESFDIRKQ